jgi:diguanylate cyclase (GGDEF)-like protein
VFEVPNGHLQVTMSFGVSELGPDVETSEALIKQADHALYKAKQNGRNRVESFKD